MSTNEIISQIDKSLNMLSGGSPDTNGLIHSRNLAQACFMLGEPKGRLQSEGRSDFPQSPPETSPQS